MQIRQFWLSRTVCQTFPTIEFYLAPSTPRATPNWYTPAQAAISILVQQQAQDQQSRLLPLPGYVCDFANLDSDGVHFLPTPGQHYCMHIIDSARYKPDK
jgi:hypothetical protein